MIVRWRGTSWWSCAQPPVTVNGNKEKKRTNCRVRRRPETEEDIQKLSVSADHITVLAGDFPALHLIVSRLCKALLYATGIVVAGVLVVVWTLGNHDCDQPKRNAV